MIDATLFQCAMYVYNTGDCVGSVASGSSCTMLCADGFTLDSHSTATYSCYNGAFTSSIQAKCIPNGLPCTTFPAAPTLGGHVGEYADT